MFLKFTEKFGKPTCVILYAVFSFFAAKGLWIPLALLGALHFVEYFVAALKVAREAKIDAFTAFINCLAFGFTWWLPIKNAKK